jgi:hypothetical protein
MINQPSPLEVLTHCLSLWACSRPPLGNLVLQPNAAVVLSVRPSNTAPLTIGGCVQINGASTLNVTVDLAKYSAGPHRLNVYNISLSCTDAGFTTVNIINSNPADCGKIKGPNLSLTRSEVVALFTYDKSGCSAFPDESPRQFSEMNLLYLWAALIVF